MSHAETPKTGARNVEQPAPLPEPTPTTARPSDRRKLSLDEALAKLADGNCGCDLCDLITTTTANLDGINGEERPVPCRSCGGLLHPRVDEMSSWRCERCGHAITVQAVMVNDLLDIIGTVNAKLDPCEHRWFEVSDPQRRWLRCSECGEAVEDAP